VAEMTLEQQRALAIATARLRLQQQAAQPQQPVAQPKAPMPQQAAPAQAPAAPQMSWNEMIEGLPVMPDEQPTQLGSVGQTVRGLVKGGIVDPLTGIAQLVGGEEERKRIALNEQSYQAQRKREGADGIEWSRLIGNALMSIVPGGAAMKGAQAAGAGRVATGVAGGIGGAAALPVTQSLEEDADSFALQKLRDVGFSGLVGGGVAKIGGVLTPQLKEGAAEQLAAGVRVAPGQAYGGLPGWVFRQMESIGFGPTDKAIRTSFTRSAGNEVLRSIDDTVPSNIKDGMQMSGYIQEKVQAFYDTALEKLGKVVPDNQFADDLRVVVADNVADMSPRAKKIFEGTVQKEIIDRFKLGAVPKGAVAPAGVRQLPAADGIDLKGINNFLKKQIEVYGKKTGRDNEALATAYEDALNAFRSYTSRVDKDGLLAKADEAWAKLYRFADAASSPKAIQQFGGSFSATELAQAATRQATELQAGAGLGPMGQFARKGVSVLGNEPDVLNAGYRQAVIAGKIATGTALSFFNPAVAVPLLVASGISYKAAEQLMKNPSAARIAVQRAVEKLGPQVAGSIAAREESRAAQITP
jgi:hypothetical protein